MLRFLAPLPFLPLGDFWRRHGLTVVLGGLLLAVLALPLAGGFVGDDGAYVMENVVLRGLSWSELGQLFTSPRNPYEFLPLRDLTYWIDWQLFGAAPLGYKLHNGLWYLAAIGFAYRAVATLLALAPAGRDSARAVAWLTTALFAFHPAHIEAVAWISGRKDVLAGALAFLTLWQFARGLAAKQVGAAALLTAVAAVAAQVSKATSAPTLAVMWLVGLAWWRLGAPSAARAGRALVLLVPGTLAVAAIFAYQSAVSVALNVRLTPETSPVDVFADPLPRALLVTGQLLANSFWPFATSLFHDVLAPERRGLLLALGGAMPGLLGFAAWAFLRRQPAWALGVVLLGLYLLPFLQLAPVVGWTMAADRFLFLPSLGVALLGASGLAALRQRHTQVARAAAAVVLLALAAAAGQRAALWRDWDTLVAHDARGAQYYMARYLWIHRVLLLRGEYATAREVARRGRDTPQADAILGAYVETQIAAALANRSRDPAPFAAALARLDALVAAAGTPDRPGDVPFAAFVKFMNANLDHYFRSALRAYSDHEALREGYQRFSERVAYPPAARP